MTAHEVVAKEELIRQLLDAGLNREAWEVARFTPALSGALRHEARMAYVYRYND